MRDGVYRKVGPAKVSTETGRDRRDQGQADLKAGDVLVLICRGPLGSGMEETYQVTSALKLLPFRQTRRCDHGRPLQRSLYGRCIGHVSPEALAGGPLARLQKGT